MEERIVALEKKVAALEEKLQNGRAPAMTDPRMGQIRDTMERLAFAKRESLQRVNQSETPLETMNNGVRIDIDRMYEDALGRIKGL
jgi:hypothetical protein